LRVLDLNLDLHRHCQLSVVALPRNQLDLLGKLGSRKAAGLFCARDMTERQDAGEL